MGYTHYYSLNKEQTQAKWDKFVEDVKTVKKHLPKHSNSSGGYYLESPLFLNGCYRNKDAIFNSEKILFNGGDVPANERVEEEDGFFKEEELSHETFFLDNRSDRHFCKTARKPYDLMVQCVLILAKHHFKKDFSFSSDGEIEDWLEAYKLVSKYFKIKPELMIGLCYGEDSIKRESLKLFSFEK